MRDAFFLCCCSIATYIQHRIDVELYIHLRVHVCAYTYSISYLTYTCIQRIHSRVRCRSLGSHYLPPCVQSVFAFSRDWSNKLSECCTDSPALAPPLMHTPVQTQRAQYYCWEPMALRFQLFIHSPLDRRNRHTNMHTHTHTLTRSRAVRPMAVKNRRGRDTARWRENESIRQSARGAINSIGSKQKQKIRLAEKRNECHSLFCRPIRVDNNCTYDFASLSLYFFSCEAKTVVSFIWGKRIGGNGRTFDCDCYSFCEKGFFFPRIRDGT